jgi:hypothetical protein
MNPDLNPTITVSMSFRIICRPLFEKAVAELDIESEASDKTKVEVLVTHLDVLAHTRSVAEIGWNDVGLSKVYNGAG